MANGFFWQQPTHSRFQQPTEGSAMRSCSRSGAGTGGISRTSAMTRFTRAFNCAAPQKRSQLIGFSRLEVTRFPVTFVHATTALDCNS